MADRVDVRKTTRGTARSASQHQTFFDRQAQEEEAKRPDEEDEENMKEIPPSSSSTFIFVAPVRPTDDSFVSKDVVPRDQRVGSSDLLLVAEAEAVEQGTKRTEAKKGALVNSKSSGLLATAFTPSPALLPLQGKKPKATPMEAIPSSAGVDESRREKEKRSGAGREEKKKNVKKVSTSHQKNEAEPTSKSSRSTVSFPSDGAVKTNASPSSSTGTIATKVPIVSRRLSDALLSRGPITASLLSSEVKKVKIETENRKSPSLTQEEAASVVTIQALQKEVPASAHTVSHSSPERRRASGTHDDHTTVLEKACHPGSAAAVGRTEKERSVGRQETPREEEVPKASLMAPPIVFMSKEGSTDDADGMEGAPARVVVHELPVDHTDRESSKGFLFTVEDGSRTASSSLPEGTAALLEEQDVKKRYRSTGEGEEPCREAIPPLQQDKFAIQEEERSGTSPTRSPSPTSSSTSRRSPPLSVHLFESHSPSFPLFMVADSLSPKAYSSVASVPHSSMANESLVEDVLDDVIAPLRSAFASIMDGSPKHGKEIGEYLEFSIPLLPFTNFLTPTTLTPEAEEALETGEGKDKEDLLGKDSAVTRRNAEGEESVQSNVPKSVRRMRREYLQSLRHKTRLARPVLSLSSYHEGREEEDDEIQEHEESVDDLILGDTDYHHQNIQFILDLFGEFWMAKHNVSVLHCADRLGFVSSEKGDKKKTNAAPVKDSNEMTASVVTELEKEKLDSTILTSEYYSMQALGVLFEHQGEVED